MPKVTPSIDPLSITLHDGRWAEDIVLSDLDVAERLAIDIANAVKLLRYHVNRQRSASGRPCAKSS